MNWFDVELAFSRITAAGRVAYSGQHAADALEVGRALDYGRKAEARIAALTAAARAVVVGLWGRDDNGSIWCDWCDSTPIGSDDPRATWVRTPGDHYHHRDCPVADLAALLGEEDA